MTEFENQYKVCMELIKQKSKEVSETDIILTAIKDPLTNIRRRGKKSGNIEKRQGDALVLILLLYIVLLYLYFSDN